MQVKNDDFKSKICIAFSLSLLTIPTLNATAAAVAQTTAPAQTEAVQPSLDSLTKDFYKARDAKDWGKCLEIADACAKLGEEGLNLSKQMRFSVFVRAGDEKKVMDYFQNLRGQFKWATEAYFDRTADTNKASAMTDKLLDLLDKQATDLKLAKFKMLLNADKPAEYLAFAQKLMAGPDKENHVLLNYLAWYIVCPDSETPAVVKMNPVQFMSASGPVYSYTMLKHTAGFRTKEMLNLAKKAAEIANKLTKYEDGGHLDTLGWTYYRIGEKNKAYETEMKASKKDHDNATYKTVAEWFLK